jgi:hypothetical protein
MEVREHEIYQYLQKNDGKTTMKAICNDIIEGKDKKLTIKDKLSMMAQVLLMMAYVFEVLWIYKIFLGF